MRSDYTLVEHVYYIAPDGVQYPLFGGRRALLSFSGFGMPKIDYITDSGPFVHGERVRGYKLQSRVIDLTLYESGCKRQDRWDNLGAIVDAVRMNRGGAGRILVVLPDFSEREIDAWILDGPAGNYQGDSSLLAFDIRENLRFLAPYPIWRNPHVREHIFAVSSGDACLPTCLPTCVGSETIVASLSINYPGTFASYPTIAIAGPIDYPTIRNTTTGREIRMLYEIASGESVTIELQPDRALVYNNYGVNLIGAVEDANDLADFAIEPAGVDVPDGINKIYVAGSGGVSGATQVTIRYYEMFLGVPR